MLPPLLPMEGSRWEPGCSETRLLVPCFDHQVVRITDLKTLEFPQVPPAGKRQGLNPGVSQKAVWSSATCLDILQQETEAETDGRWITRALTELAWLCPSHLNLSFVSGPGGWV